MLKLMKAHPVITGLIALVLVAGIAAGSWALFSTPTEKPEPVPSPTETQETNAMIEDFETSMIGYRYDDWKNNSLGSSYILILIENEEELNIPEGEEGEITCVFSSEGAVMPNISMKPKTIKITHQEADHLKTIFSTFPDNLMFEEGEAKMYAVADPTSVALKDVPNKDDYNYTMIDDNYNFAGVNLGSATTLEIGFPRDNDSYPTSWLRKEPYASELKEINNVDINDPWYDNWKYQEKIEVKKTNTTKTGPETTTVVVDSPNQFSVKQPFAWSQMSLEEMNTQLESMGYETIPER